MVWAARRGERWHSIRTGFRWGGKARLRLALWFGFRVTVSQREEGAKATIWDWVKRHEAPVPPLEEVVTRTASLWTAPAALPQRSPPPLSHRPSAVATAAGTVRRTAAVPAAPAPPGTGPSCHRGRQTPAPPARPAGNVMRCVARSWVFKLRIQMVESICARRSIVKVKRQADVVVAVPPLPHTVKRTGHQTGAALSSMSMLLRRRTPTRAEPSPRRQMQGRRPWTHASSANTPEGNKE